MDTASPHAKHAPQLVRRFVKAIAGLFIFAAGVYVSIQANIGLNPFDVFTMGISKQLSLSFGDAGALVSGVILLLDLFAGERIGPGTVLAVLITGKGVDLFFAWNPLPKQTSPPLGIVCILCGVTIMAVGQRLYMPQALGAGPRDLFMVAVGKKLRRWPIGLVQTVILGSVTFTGWLLGGPVGLGTVIAFFSMGPIMQLVFRIGRFDPRDTVHDTFGSCFARRAASGQAGSRSK